MVYRVWVFYLLGFGWGIGEDLIFIKFWYFDYFIGLGIKILELR